MVRNLSKWLTQTNSGLGPSFDISYGVASGLQLYLDPGLAFDDLTARGLRVGIGDTELGAKYPVLQANNGNWWPQASLYPLTKVPTGNAARDLGASYVQAFLPIWLQKDFDKATVYDGGGYWINPGVGNTVRRQVRP